MQEQSEREPQSDEEVGVPEDLQDERFEDGEVRKEDEAETNLDPLRQRRSRKLKAKVNLF